MSQTPPQAVVLSPAEAERLQQVSAEINDIVSKVESGELTHLDALKQVHSIASANLDLLKKSQDAYNSVVDIEYALAYNSLIDGASLEEVRQNLLEDAWAKLKDSLPDLAKSLILARVAEGDREKAQALYSEFKDYLPEEEQAELGVLLSPEFEELLSAVSNEDYKAITETLKKIEEEGKYEQFKQVYQKYYGVDLDELRKTAYTNYIYDILASSETPEDALKKLEEARAVAEEAGLSDLLADIQNSVTALSYARQGDVKKYVDTVSQIQDSEIRKYALAKGISLIEESNPEALASLDSETKAKLQELLNNAGFNVDVDHLIIIGKGAKIAVDLNKLIEDGKLDEAIQLWQGLSQAEKEAVSLVLGKTPEDIQAMLDAMKYAEETAEKANHLVELVNNAKYIDAYEYWKSLPDRDKEAIAGLLDTSTQELSNNLALWAGLQALAQLENPTLDQVKRVLAQYLGEEKAEQVARELLEESPLFKVKTLADQGKYEEALQTALREDIPDDERRMAVQYLLSAVSEKEGPEALAQFIEKHKQELQPYLPQDVLKAVETVSQAGVIAGDLIQTIKDVASEEYGQRLGELVSEYTELLKARKWQEAEELLLENKKLLQEAEVNGTKLFDLLLELYTIARAGDVLDRDSARLEELAGKVQSNTESVAREADRIAKEAEAYMDSVSKLQHVDTETKKQYLDALRRLGAFAYALESQALLTAGSLDQALAKAEKASQLDPQFQELYQTVKVLKLAVEDRDNLKQNLECIMENVLQIKPRRARRGGKPKHIAFM